MFPRSCGVADPSTASILNSEQGRSRPRRARSRPVPGIVGDRPAHNLGGGLDGDGLTCALIMAINRFRGLSARMLARTACMNLQIRGAGDRLLCNTL